MTTPQQQDSVYQQGRLDLDVQANQQDHFRSYRAVAKVFDFPQTTLQRQISGQASRRNTVPNNCLLTLTEENRLLRWILSMDRRRLPPQAIAVREMVRLLITQRVQTPLQVSIGQHWIRNFINQHDKIKSKYNQKYNYQHAKCKDPELIRAWF